MRRHRCCVGCEAILVMTEVGEIIFVRGRPERVIEVEMILRDGKPFYVALRTEKLKTVELDHADQ
jgi:hypothetical protein